MKSALLRIVHAACLGPADARVYAAVRIAFACTFLLHLVQLWPHRIAFFSDVGLVDLPTVRDAIGDRPYYSLFHHFSSPGEITAIFGLTALATIALAAGVAMRASLLVIYASALSYTHQAFPLLHGWDVLLRVTAFILLLSPCPRVWTIRRNAPAATHPVTAPVYGLTLLKWQLIVLYLQTFWLKTPDAYWRSGEFLQYFLVSLYARLPHPAVMDVPGLTAAATHATLLIELTVPILLCFRRTRPLAFVLGWGLHGGIALTGRLTVFSAATMLLYLAFLDGRDLQKITTVTHRLHCRFRPQNTDFKDNAGDSPEVG